MSTIVDAGPPQVRRRGWWLVPEFAALAILAIVAIPFLGTGGGTGDEVARRAAEVIERASPAEHHDHGHEFAAGQQIFCGVDVFGTDPATVTSAAEVRVVYGYFFCAAGVPGTPYLESSRVDGPVVVTLTGTPRAQIAQSGDGYADRVRAMMPDQYEDRCFHGLSNPAVAAAVRDRYESALLP